MKVASYNIRKAIGTDRRRNPGRIIDVLNELDADVVALQEADRRFGSRAAAIPPLLLEQYSDYQAVPLDVQTDSMGWHGNAILTRKPATILAQDIVHIPCLEPRGAVMAQIESGGRRYCIIGMHLDLSGLWRRKQAAAIVKLARAQQNISGTMLLGDLNEWSAGRGCLRDFQHHFNVLDSGKSFHSRSPVARLDRIMHCPQLHAVATGVHITPAARKASDHLPIWAQIEWAGPTGAAD